MKQVEPEAKTDLAMMREKRKKAWVTDQETPTWTAEFKKKKKRKGETNKKQKQKNFPEKKIKFQIKRV